MTAAAGGGGRTCDRGSGANAHVIGAAAGVRMGLRRLFRDQVFRPP